MTQIIVAPHGGDDTLQGNIRNDSNTSLATWQVESHGA